MKKIITKESVTGGTSQQDAGSVTAEELKQIAGGLPDSVLGAQSGSVEGALDDSPSEEDDNNLSSEEKGNILDEVSKMLSEHDETMNEALGTLQGAISDVQNKTLEVATKKVSDITNAAKKAIEEQIKKNAPVVVKMEGKKTKTVSGAHEALPLLLVSMQASHQSGGVLMIGGAGCGKSTLGYSAAQAMGLKHYFQGAVDSEHKLMGYMDANGKYVSTPLYNAYKGGGVFTFDEIDASSAEALLALNGMIAGHEGDFPCGITARHKDFYCLATANTFGYGANRDYVGRNRLDGATLDRFIKLEVQYDKRIEQVLANGQTEWMRYCQYVRSAIKSERLIVSPRAIKFGASLLEQGIKPLKVAGMLIWDGIAEGTRRKVDHPAMLVLADMGGGISKEDIRESITACDITGLIALQNGGSNE